MDSVFRLVEVWWLVLEGRSESEERAVGPCGSREAL